MIQEIIRRIETEIQTNVESDKQKQDLLELISFLKIEIESLKDKYHDDARSIAKFAETGVIEATRETRNEELFNHALAGMQLSVRRFEVSHPKMIGLINTIGKTLSDIGI